MKIKFLTQISSLALIILFHPSIGMAVDDATVQAIDTKADTANAKADGNNSRIQALEAEDAILHQRIDNIELTQGPQGAPGADGLNCWDLNSDGVTDTSEDINGDGYWNALDCQGSGSLSIPVIWSGYCLHDKISSTSWEKYCTDAEDFNTSQSYLSINPDGTFTVLIPGYYRINYYATWRGSYVYSHVMVNGVEVQLHRDYEGNRDTVAPHHIDLTWPMNVGDTFSVEVFSQGIGFYAGKDTYGQQSSRLQVSFVGPK